MLLSKHFAVNSYFFTINGKAIMYDCIALSSDQDNVSMLLSLTKLLRLLPAPALSPFFRTFTLEDL